MDDRRCAAPATLFGMTIAARDFAAHNVVIHHATIFDGRTPVTCGASGVPCPASDEWRYVTCPRCRALAPSEVHARPSADAPSLCGMPANGKGWTKKKSHVTCSACADEIERRRVRQ